MEDERGADPISPCALRTHLDRLDDAPRLWGRRRERKAAVWRSGLFRYIPDEEAEAMWETMGATCDTAHLTVQRDLEAIRREEECVEGQTTSGLLGHYERNTTLRAAAMAIQVFIGGEHETRSIHNMTRLVDAGLRYGIPVMAVTAVGKEMVRDARYFRLACRICAELGAHIVKTYYVADGFETITASCPVPIVMAGGKKIPELDALTMAHNAVRQGAAGVDMGRNIFQSDAPRAMIRTVHKVVHANLLPDDALALYHDLKAEELKV